MEIDKIMEYIASATDEDIDVLIESILRRQKQMHQNTEPMYLELPVTRPEECDRILEKAREILHKVIAKTAK